MSQDNINIWYDIEETKGKYQITKTGLVRNKHTGLILKSYANSEGYLYHYLYIKGKRISRSLHRLVAQTFIPNTCNYPEVNHEDGNKANNIVSNLVWCTRAYNMRHALRTGLKIPVFGEQHGMSKLDDHTVLEIIDKYLSGKYSQRALAKEYGVSQPTIGNIFKGHTWEHVEANSSKSKDQFIVHATSGYRGVDWDKKNNRWRTHITINYKKVHIGVFRSALEAAYVYNQCAEQLFGDKAKLNKV